MKTISENVTEQIIEKKSKFICDLIYVNSIEEVERNLEKINKKYYDAKHHSFAYRLQNKNEILEKSSDDGEPSGTAGAPMLNILQKNELANILVVVTRYFGGILLGTGGLVRAYSNSTLKVIEQSQKIHKCEGLEMLVTLTYNEFNTFQYYCKNNNIFISNVEYGEFIECNIELEIATKAKLLKDFETKKIILQNIKEITKKYITKSI